jgi:hypothetical protein
MIGITIRTIGSWVILIDYVSNETEFFMREAAVISFFYEFFEDNQLIIGKGILFLSKYPSDEFSIAICLISIKKVESPSHEDIIQFFWIFFMNI